MKLLLVVVSGVALALGLAAAPTAAAPQPNIILLLADDLGYGELGCQGNPQIATPHIDSLARHGIRFTQAYVTAPNCSPSRAGLLTGKIPTRFGYEFNPIGARNDDPGTGLPSGETTLAELLHDAGYTTGLIGKWHLGGAPDFHPQRHGFDEFFGFLHEGHYFVPPPWRGVTTMLRRKALPGHTTGRWAGGRLIYSTHLGTDEPDYDANNPIVRSSQPVDERAHLTDAFTREAVDFIGRHADKPFYLHLAYNAVHSPMQGADRYLKKFAHIEYIHRRIFAAMLAHLDDSVGAILKKVRAEKLEQRTLVVFLSDNGGPTRELTSRNTPLRGEKGSMYEGGLRVPFLMQMPGTLPAGRVEDRWIVSVDLFATAAALAGVRAPRGIDGVNLLPFLTGRNAGAPHETFFWRQGSRSALRNGEWKSVAQKQDAQVKRELFNLRLDSAEADNRADAEPAKLAELQQLWEQFNAQMREPLFGQR
jgi:arylsulfatase A-like enzyme